MEKKAVEERVKKNGDYWKSRFESLEDEQYQNSADYYKGVQKQFSDASKGLQDDINKWYQRLADNNGISYAEAGKFLKESELEEFKWSVEQYIKAGEENAVDQRWMKELENASARHHISYLEAMKMQVQQHAEVVSAQLEGGMTEFLYESYGDQYYRNAFEIAKGTGVGSNLAKLDDRKVDAVIRKPWAQDGANFSDRIWNNKQKLVNTLDTELTQSIIRGAPPRQAIDKLAKTMEVSKSQAGRLIMTESAAIASMAQKDSFKELGVEQYEILATLDSLTSEICQELDGKVFEMKDYEVGRTAPPFHPRCRSTTIPYFDDELSDGEMRAARDEETGKTVYVPANMKYGEWEKQFIDGRLKKVSAPDNLSVPGNIKDDARRMYDKEISLLPEKQREVIDSAVNEIIVDPNRNSGYDREKGILYLAEVLDEGEVVHEMAHALETKLDIWNDSRFTDAINSTIGEINPLWDAVIDEDTFERPITRLGNTENLISIYQGRLYDEQVPLVDDHMNFNVYSLGDFFSEAYREYIYRPDNLKKIQPHMFDYIDRIMEET